jgi:hypothetical protein
MLETLEMSSEDTPIHGMEISNNILFTIPANVIQQSATRITHPRMMCGSEFYEETNITGGSPRLYPTIYRSTTPESGMGSMPGLVDAFGHEIDSLGNTIYTPSVHSEDHTGSSIHSIESERATSESNQSDTSGAVEALFAPIDGDLEDKPDMISNSDDSSVAIDEDQGWRYSDNDEAWIYSYEDSEYPVDREDRREMIIIDSIIPVHLRRWFSHLKKRGR